MAPLYWLVWLALFSGSSAGDAWDNFANNLATDLAPILQLFGEQVSKQFLSESTTIWDNIIFAMAPLGILTAVVSAIRVCGSPLLKAFVGRAQEGAGIAEAELCSSTGRDVCEMYQNGAITRVFGRPKILEFVHDPHQENFYAAEGEEKVASAGLYTFKEYYKTERGKREWVELRKSPRKRPRTEEDASSRSPDDFAPNPNLMLNIGFRNPSRCVLRPFAVVAVLMQASVMVFAVVVQKSLKLTREGRLPPPWALPTTIIGTVLLCTGMFMCAFLIEQSTIERMFTRPKAPTKHPQPRSVMHWIQPGGQVVGDQSFDSFAYSDKDRPLRQYISSWRKPVSQHESLMTWITVIITMIGFVVQFVGLRGVHSAVSVCQLAAVVIMSALRALLRTKRLEGDANRIPSEFIQNASGRPGHELDWLAFELCHMHGQLKPVQDGMAYSWVRQPARE
ncbi:hypothetical protein BU26DRAFT_538289 [Trematosphaeria pertusa]|uniref:Uncharacterized protein n=1 Tax=Trematosphaeria pertusa TaxID=390896 RepID=A0A6A6IUC6_9PLEO|nr:uncharacterized protein BU26DRAFT_538289 [Trematosphaeria pertusa]KAF2253522.1 hypothetical protein BU26DRAFT_538289 [Trematosphaeria pertusa]